MPAQGGIKAPRQTEAQFQRAVVEYAELNQWLVYHTYDSRRSNPGFPDLVLVRDGKLIFAELKSERGRLSQDQERWLRALRRVELALAVLARFVVPDRGVHVRLWRPSCWPEIERELSAKERG